MKITHLYQSGFLVELEHCLLLFDHYKGTLPPLPAEKPLYVLVSHLHYDHYDPSIWELDSRHKTVYYLLDEDIHPPAGHEVLLVKPHQHYSWHGLELDTLKSTDEGCAFVVTVEGITFYHAGDLNWWHWEGEPDAFNIAQKADYQAELARIAGRPINVAFVPLDPRQEDSASWGMAEFLRQCPDCKHIFPMHYQDNRDAMLAYLNLPVFDPVRERIHTQEQWDSKTSL